MEFSASDLQLTVDLEADGRQHGHIDLPALTCASGFARTRLPISVLKRGTGPVITLMAGLHGDECEGPITLNRLAREVDLDALTGTLILLPCLNPQAMMSGHRHGSCHGTHLHEVFPGNPQGSAVERLADFITQHIFKRSDLVLDMRSGGKALSFTPSAAVWQHSDTDVQQRAEASMIAFGAPDSVRFLAPNMRNAIADTLDNLGTPYVQTAIGGSNLCTAHDLSIAWRGCHNLLSQCGLSNQELQLCATRMLEVKQRKAFVIASADGLFDVRRRLGQTMWQGDLFAQLLDVRSSGCTPTVIDVPLNGVLLAVRQLATVKAGDCLAIIGDEVHR